MNQNLIKKIVQQAKNQLNTAGAIVQHLLLELSQIYNAVQPQLYRMESLTQVFVAAASASINFTTLLPKNSRVKFVTLNFDTAVVLATAVKVGIGTAASPSLLLLSTVTVAKNTIVVSIPLEAAAIFAAATQLQLSACATGGTAAGTITSGTLRATVLYETVDDPTAAP